MNHRRARRAVLIAGLGLLAAFANVTPWGTGSAATNTPLGVTVTQLSSFNTLGFGTEFGPFVWRGGLTLSGNAEDFGGLSGLTLGQSCEDLLSISDGGNWFQARLTYENGMLAGLSAPRMAPLLDSKGKPQRNKSWADGEALAPLGKGKVGLAYERKVRFGVYDVGSKGLKAPFEAIPHPAGIDHGPENGEVESFGLLPSGQYIAIAEKQYDADGNIRAWMWKGKDELSFSIARYGSYNVTDLAVLPDGSVLTMERSFTRRSLPGMAIRRFDPKDVRKGHVIRPAVLLEASVPFYTIDNMEGIAVCERDGETRVTLQSDDNFHAGLQSTILLQFAYRPD